MPRRIAALATCNLNQWAMDFDGNLKRIKQSINEAKKFNSKYRIGPELEITGYGCEDHYCELDTIEHSWECLQELIDEGYTDDIICDIGMPVIYNGVRYNCRIFILNKKILLIRPKIYLANDGNYREGRYFSPWYHRNETMTFHLPLEIQKSCNQKTCPIGEAALLLNDTCIASESCEELFTPESCHIHLTLGGVEIITNGSGSHHQLRKLNERLDLFKNSTKKCGAVYVYSNQRGCDGGRLYYDGCACIVLNGDVLCQGSQFSLSDVETISAYIDLDQVISFRSAKSSLRDQAASKTNPINKIYVDFDLCQNDHISNLKISKPIKIKESCVEEELAYGPACWLWDYLRRSGACGFLLPLSGGADSSSVAAIVGCMCQMLIEEIKRRNQEVIEDVISIGQYQKLEEIQNLSARELANRIFVTMYQGTSNSSHETQSRSKLLAEQIGSYHIDIKIENIIQAVLKCFFLYTGIFPKYKIENGTEIENIALQNIQARIRMVVSFLFAQLMPWIRGMKGYLLVLGSSNVDEGLRGYLTKYDCSSADINPIGGISKQDIRKFLKWASINLGYSILAQVEAAKPSAELEPLSHGKIQQIDEIDMGMTYEELSIFGKLRKINRYGPVSTLRQLLIDWIPDLTPTNIANKVKHFYTQYARNRHKATVLTPYVHLEDYSPDDNRFDHRQFLYESKWTWQFKKIDNIISEMDLSKQVKQD